MRRHQDRCVVYKRCGCADAGTGRQLGGRCERLRRGGFTTAEQAARVGRKMITTDRNDVAGAGYTLARWLRCWLEMQ
jgi:hypothetical protein